MLFPAGPSTPAHPAGAYSFNRLFEWAMAVMMLLIAVTLAMPVDTMERAALKRIAESSIRDPKRRRPDGKTTFNVSFYAVSKDGKFAGGCIYPGGKMAVHDGDSARVVQLDPLFER